MAGSARSVASAGWQAVKRTAIGLRDRRVAWAASQSSLTATASRSETDGDSVDVTGASRPAGGDGDGDGAIARAEDEAARLSTPDQPLGRLGRPLNRRSPFFIGLTGAAGVAVAYGLLQLLSAARDVLTLIGLATFLAIGLSPAVDWLVRRRLPRWSAVLVVLFAIVVLVGGFVAAAVPPLVEQANHFVQVLPTLWQEMRNHSSLIGRINDRFHLQQRLTSSVSGSASTLLTGVIGAGQMVFSALVSTVTVVVLTIYFLADMPRIRRTFYRLVPASRRPRAILIGDEIFTRIGGFVLGNLITSLIAGVATFLWAVVTGIPYALLLGLFVAIMDLIPVVGSTLAGLVVALVALTVSFPLALATGGYIIVYRLLEDYLLVPRIIGKTVRVPAITTVVAVLVGGALLGIIGALVAIPVAAVIGLVLEEVAFPRLDRG